MREIFIIGFVIYWVVIRFIKHWGAFYEESDFADFCFRTFPFADFFTFIGAIFYFSVLPLGFGLVLYLIFC